MWLAVAGVPDSCEARSKAGAVTEPLVPRPPDTGPPHDHAWHEVEGERRGQFQQYRCDVCSAEWPPEPGTEDGVE